jgi:nicotinamidase-related amidase
MAKSALLVADIQNGVVNLVLGTGPSARKEAFLQRMSTTIKAARKAGVQIIYCVIDLRKGHPEVKPHSALHKALNFMGRFLEGEGSKVHASIAPQEDEGDLIVYKRRVSAFVGSDLEIILRSLGVGDLAVAGLSTSGVVLSTVRQAADLDFDVTVLEDLCAEFDSVAGEGTHRVLMENVLPGQALVMNSGVWVDGLEC